MSEKKTINVEELSEVKYHDLLAKFKELGIPEVWKAGTKKVTMINNAIDKLKIKSSLESLGLDKEEVSKEVEAMAKKKAKAEADKVLEQAKLAEKEDKKEVVKLKKAKLSKEDIEKNIKIIQSNIKFGVPSQKEKLQKKLEALMDILSKI
jgi:outer membrane translocation and assembly module TamA